MNISSKYPDGTEGPLILQTERCFSFGVQKNSGFKQISYSLPIVLYDRTPQGKYDPTSEQAEFVKVFENIIKQCKEWLVENGGKIDRPAIVDKTVNKTVLSTIV